MAAKAGWYWYEDNPKSATYWDGESWGKAVPLRKIQDDDPVYNGETGKPITRVPRQITEEQWSNWAKAVLGFVVVIGGGIWMFTACMAPAQPSGPDSFSAGMACETFVKDRLKSPATAVFSHTSATTTARGYEATTTVDSENSFGAMLRSNWTCEISYNESDKKWHLEDISQR